jgi:U3 small nucleolar RNA-associated protein 12
MSDDIHCLRFTPNGLYYAVSLLDSTIKVFFADSDKLFLSMYGHKLPALSFDITSDELLLVSGKFGKKLFIYSKKKINFTGEREKKFHN